MVTKLEILLNTLEQNLDFHISNQNMYDIHIWLNINKWLINFNYQYFNNILMPSGTFSPMLPQKLTTQSNFHLLISYTCNTSTIEDKIMKNWQKSVNQLSLNVKIFYHLLHATNENNCTLYNKECYQRPQDYVFIFFIILHTTEKKLTKLWINGL